MCPDMPPPARCTITNTTTRTTATAADTPVPQLPTGPSWAYEVKLDGHRTVLWRTEDSVRLQSRTGRDVTALRRDLAVAAIRLPPGVILDGVM
ncbi:ATP-dependent DNA ligase [Streptomyces aurantiogriseus]|uniref:ATP-dependent DNA ligase n=1 Tax=Streptomyces aurantiogriseus TaxID=66870 RepID=UPI001676F156|nr:hypothetical protein [Streptomyces aurantiogriseus]